ncbi:MAG: hypothetical protein AB7T38_02510 [Nitrospirales bacterium]
MKTPVDELIEHLIDELKLDKAKNNYRSQYAVGIERADEVGGVTKTGVDKNDRVIYGVAVATEGPALGHGIDLDQTFLEQLTEAGNAVKSGIKARFDHPNPCVRSMGTTVGRFKQFRKTGPVVRADLHLLKAAEKSPDGNFPEYLMELAVEDPQSFGTSIVFSGKEEYLLEPDGTRKKGEDGQPLRPRARLEKLDAADVVDQPAANPNGVFHALSRDTFIGKFTAFLDRYLELKGLPLQPSLSPQSETHEKENSAMGNEPNSPPPADDRKELIKAERARLSAINKYGKIFEVGEDKIANFIESDQSMLQILMGMIDDAETRQFFNRKTALQLIETAPNPSAGGPTDPGATTSASAKPAPTKDVIDMSPAEWEAHCQAEFEASKDLQHEFMEWAIYWAFKQNEDRSRVLRGADEKE